MKSMFLQVTSTSQPTIVSSFVTKWGRGAVSGPLDTHSYIHCFDNRAFSELRLDSYL